MLERIILVGLGNPGDRYRATRHNLGFQVLDALSERHRVKWTSARTSYEMGVTTIDGARVVLLRPRTYMNRSGIALRHLRQQEEIEPEDVLVLADDIALPLGHLRLRRRGRDGGHNGLRSIIEELGTIAFPRVRMGVGPVPADEDPADFVLSGFPKADRARVDALVSRAVRCVEDLIVIGYEEAMGRHNAPPPDASESG